MATTFNEEYLEGFITKEEFDAMKPEAEAALKKVQDKSGAGSDYLGWWDHPLTYDVEEYNEIKKAAKFIKNNCDILVVIGIGGSYLGARAAIEFIKTPMYNRFAEMQKSPRIYFTGNSVTSSTLAELIEICKVNDVCLNVISKSGKTTETAIAFRLLRDLMIEKYGEEGAKKRIFATTDKKSGALKSMSDKYGYKTFVVPDNIGGRYSVLSSVGLLPIAVAGCNIDAMMKGALDAYKKFNSEPYETNDAMRYAAARNILYRKGKKIEILACHDNALRLFNEWWKQLFGESEGKDGKGILPDSVVYSTDLHSLGQLIQQGERNLFETVIHETWPDDRVIIPTDKDDYDELNYIAGKNLKEVSDTVFLATLLAHKEGGVPNIVLDYNERSEYEFGYMVYFFEMACAISGYILGINPFDQPGVEAYKNNMFALLGKKGEKFDEIRKNLNNIK